MKKVYIKGDIGWEVTAATVGKQLNAAKGEDVEIEIASSGGSVFEGLKIFNEIKNYSGNVTFKLVGLVASMASYIALARGPENVIAEDNAIFMIHNVSSGAWGDYRVMGKVASLLNDLTAHLSKVYSKASGQSISEIREMLDDETFLYGPKIIDAGFAGEMVEGEGGNEEDTNALLALAKLAVAETTAKVKNLELSNEETEELFKMVMHIAKPQTPAATPAAKVKPVEETTMTLEEFKAKHPELYAAAISAGVATGTEQERTRVAQIVAFRGKMPANAHAVVDNALTNGDDFATFSLNATMAITAGAEVVAGTVPPVKIGSETPEADAVMTGEITTPEALDATSAALAGIAGLTPAAA